MLPVLMYHGLHASPSDPGRFDAVYSVEPDAFARQLDWLVANGYRTVRLDEIDPSAPEPRCVAITFDDGDVSNRTVALPLLRARGLVADFFVTSDFVGEPGMLTPDDVRALADAGMGVGAHGRTHRFLEDLDADSLDRELADSKRALEAIVGRPITSMALPGGRGGERELRAARALGYRAVAGSVPGVNAFPGENATLERVAVTRTLDDAAFAALVAWRGVAPRLARLRYHALAWPKRVLGNARYARWRARVLGA